MPNRYVREGAIESENVDKLGWAAEVFWRRLLNRVDDFGRYTANPELLKANLFPLRVNKVSAADIGKWLSDCESADLVSTWKGNDGKRYLVVHRWKQERAKFSKYPEPPQEICMRMKAIANSCKHMHANVLDPDPDPDPGTDTEKEGAAESGGAPSAGKPPKPKREPFPDDSLPMRAAKGLWNFVGPWSEGQAKEPSPATYQAWAVEFDRLFRLDGRTPAQLQQLFEWIDEQKESKDGFCWRKNIRSAATLRQRWAEGKFVGFRPREES
jgi:hypothetical protein